MPVGHPAPLVAASFGRGYDCVAASVSSNRAKARPRTDPLHAKGVPDANGVTFWDVFCWTITVAAHIVRCAMPQV